MTQKEVSFINYLSVIVKWRKFILITCFTICVITAGISLTLPKSFKASATIFPPIQDGQDFGISSLLGNLPVMNMLGGAMSEESYMFLAILKSRSLMENVAVKYNLMEEYHAKDMERTILILRDRTDIRVNDDGTITVTAEAGTKHFPNKADADSARAMASSMANFMVKELDRLNKKFRTEKARNYRLFVERRYKQSEEDMRNAEEAYNAFQKKYGAIDLPTQIEAGIKAAAELKAQIIAKEIEVGSMEQLYSRTHDYYLRAKTELEELEKKYDEFKRGQPLESYLAGDENKDVFIPIEDIPDIGLEYGRLYRDVMLQQTLIEFLLPQYEQAKIQEAKDTPTVQVLDKAIPPVKRAKPKRAIMVITMGFISFLFCVIFVFSLEFIYKAHEDENNQWLPIFDTLKNDFNSFIAKFKKKKKLK